MHARRRIGVRAPWPGLSLMTLMLLVGLRASAQGSVQDEDSRETLPVAAEIRDSSIARTATDDFPLPLLAHWNTGLRPDGFDPGFQLEQLKRGRFLLPWFALAPPDATGAGRIDERYYTKTVSLLADSRLPISFVSTQWDVVVARYLCKDTQAKAPPAEAGQACKGSPQPLSPLSSKDIWYQAGLAWAQQPALKLLQRLYPDPPLVLFVSNNEQPKVRPTSGAGDVAGQRAVGDAWIERYQLLQRGFRDGLERQEWKDRSRFIGYNAFGPSYLGRWPGWRDYSLYIPGRADPWPLALDGASVSYYVNDWNEGTDYTVRSPQIEAMNWIPMIAQVRLAKPDFWLEMSVWDGQRIGNPKDKAAFYRSQGQDYDERRYAGMVQFGMWLLRPRVVREFRDHLATRQQFGDYFDELTKAVERVHDDKLLRRFWQHGRLVRNIAESHPYQAGVPADFGDARWFLLKASANPPRPWELKTPLAVYALALELGEPGTREWLIYAFAPLGDFDKTQVAMPGGTTVNIRATRNGCFFHVAENDADGSAVGAC